jgi:hypothetical protein
MLINFKPYNLYEGVTMILRKSFIIFSLMLVTATTVYAEKVESLYNPQVIEQHYITNEDISLATAFGQSLFDKKNVKMISTAKKKFVKKRYGGLFPMNELQGTVYVQTPFAIYANTALEDVREIASNYSTRNANNILQVRSFLYMPESRMHNDTNNIVFTIVQNGNTYYPTETVRGDDQFEGPDMWITVGYQSQFDLSKLDVNSPFEVHIKSDVVKVGEAVIPFSPLNSSNKYVLDDSYSLHSGDRVFTTKK